MAPPLLLEARTPLEIAELLRSGVWAGAGVPHGDGQPVMLIPGLLSSDESMNMLAGWLLRNGYRPVRAQIKLNVDCSAAQTVRLEQTLIDASRRHHGRKVLLIGPSRGGLLGRVLARRRPDLVAGLITLATPHLDPLGNVHPLLRAQVEVMVRLGDLGLRGLMRGACRHGAAQGDAHRGACCEQFWADLRAPVPAGMPFVSVYSRTDGIVRWQSCLHPQAQQVHVGGSHCGMISARGAFEQIAVALADMNGSQACPTPVRLAA